MRPLLATLLLAGLLVAFSGRPAGAQEPAPDEPADDGVESILEGLLAMFSNQALTRLFTG